VADADTMERWKMKLCACNLGETPVLDAGKREEPIAADWKWKYNRSTP